MHDPPLFDAIEQKVWEIFVETLEPPQEVPRNRPLIEELGFDSLDMIELSFALEEFFGFEFGSRNAIEELDRRVGGEQILSGGFLTELGREVVLERMPELRKVELPSDLAAAALPRFFTLATFARILHDFYLHAPDLCPCTGEPVVAKGLKLVTKEGAEPVAAPSGDELLERWLETKAAELTEPAPA